MPLSPNLSRLEAEPKVLNLLFHYFRRILITNMEMQHLLYVIIIQYDNKLAMKNPLFTNSNRCARMNRVSTCNYRKQPGSV